MQFLTPSERRAVAVVALLFGLGAGRDLWVAAHPRNLPRPTRTTVGDPDWGPPASPESGARRLGDSSLGGIDSSSGTRQGIAGPSSPAGARVDLNRASIEDLDRLPGVGPVLAQRIVEHRERHGGFRDVDELLAVRGIGPRLLERLRPHVRVGAP